MSRRYSENLVVIAKEVYMEKEINSSMITTVFFFPLLCFRSKDSIINLAAGANEEV
jgi:hypothetical protein